MRADDRLKPFRTAVRGAGILAGSILLAACGNGGPATDSPLPVLELSQVGLFESDGVMHDIRDIAVGNSGDTWVLTGNEPFLYRFGEDGRIRSRVGRRGKGPKEMLNPWTLVAPGEGGVLVWDLGSFRLHSIDGEGSVVASRPFRPSAGTVLADIRKVSFGDPFLLVGSRGGYMTGVFADPLTNTRGFLSASVVATDSVGVVADTLINFRRDLPAGPDAAGSARFLLPIPLWTSCPGGKAAVLDPNRRLIRWITGPSAGLEWAVPLPRRPLVDDDVRAYIRHMAAHELRGKQYDRQVVDGLVEDLVRKQRGDFGTEAPPAVRMLCDAEGRIWLQHFSTRDHALGYGRTWLVVLDRERSRQVRFPEGFTPFDIGRGKVVGVVVDELDVEQVAVVQVPAIFEDVEDPESRSSTNPER